MPGLAALAAGLATFALYAFLVRPAWIPWIGRARVNILLITVDTTRADYLACYGSKSARTPNMDRLAREGVLFLRCETCIPQTTPSHCSIMTGVYPYVHGVRRNGTERLTDDAETLTEQLKAAGYGTAAVVAFFGLNRPCGLDQGFDVYDDVQPGSRNVTERGERRADAVCDDALTLLRSVGNRPFFLWAHFYDPHHPYRSATGASRDSAPAYADEIAYMDGQIGRLLDGLAALNLDRNTLVVLVGDHGEGLNDHGEFQHGFFAFETTLHVPLLMRWPGKLPAGARLEPVVRTIDLAPTILDLAGLRPLPAAQGVSLAPLMARTVSDPQIQSYGEAFEAYDVFRLCRLRTMTAGNWKYVHATSPRLYDLARDPGERQNLADSQPEQVEELREALRDLLADAPSARSVAPAAPLNEQAVRDLQSLGYVGHAAPDETAEAGEPFEPEGRDPHDYAPTIELVFHARFDLATRNYERAESQFRQAIAVLPGSPDVLRDLGFALERQGKLDESFDTYERALDVNPADAETRKHLATLLVEDKRFDRALPHLQAILQEHPDDYDTLCTLGSAFRAVQRYDEARAHLEVALRQKPNDVRALYALGLVHAEQHNVEQAADCFRRALAADPDFTPARTALNELDANSPP